ncbi:hypothetical protein FSP39_019373 [Pinctada imbricata]|uniref:N-acetyltransferase domain-containing protein n=1 Tax=Pinctada imbricata TaxID=66713 RepID=A0AA89C3V4_PINIB|nr:hypothetical protein FSP39_019373 [Pinctada imbricata]
MQCVVLHNHKSYLEDVASILNEEWKRSLSARLHSLEKSNDKFPVNLVMLVKEDGQDKVIGHSRLSIVQGKDKSCLIESVVVKRELRGKGYGRKVMDASEKYALQRGFVTMYLSTHDKQDFYRHIGYISCQPVISFGINADNLSQEFIQKFTLTNNTVSKPDSTPTTDCNKDNIADNVGGKCHLKSTVVDNSTVSPPPGPPPPPPPPTAPSSGKVEISRWDTGAISWMKKDLT